MTISVQSVLTMLRKLIQKGIIEIIDEFTKDGIRFEKYSLDPLWEKVIELFLMDEKQKQVETNKNEEANLYTMF